MAAETRNVAVQMLHARIQQFGLPRDKYAHEDLAEALANEEVVTAIVLMVGAPPPQPNIKESEEEGLERFASYVHDLSVWTMDARRALIDVWGITLDEYERVATYQAAFDRCIDKWYGLRPEGGDDD